MSVKHMKTSNDTADDDMRPHYDFSAGVRGKYADLARDGIRVPVDLLVPSPGERLRQFWSEGVRVLGHQLPPDTDLIYQDPLSPALGSFPRHVLDAFRSVALQLDMEGRGIWDRSRASAVLSYAFHSFADAVSQGAQPRGDTRPDGTGRPAVETILESVARSAITEPDHRKLPFLAHIAVASIVDHSLSLDTIQQTIDIARQLRYRQFCLLDLFSEPPRFPLRECTFDSPVSLAVHPDTAWILAEVFDTYQKSLVWCQRPGEDHARALLIPENVVPAWMHRTELGNKFHQVAGLSEIPRGDVACSAEPLSAHSRLTMR